MVRFGPAGNSPAFYAEGKKSSREVPGWLAGMGLSAYEYQCGRGVHIGEKLARQIGEETSKHDISLSLHAPYYVNLCNRDKLARTNTIKHLLNSWRVASWMGAEKIVFHPGSLRKMGRPEALSNAQKTLEEVLEGAQKERFSKVFLCPETTGKQSQLGSVDEILKLCTLHPCIVPTVDFAHVHAVSGGGLKDSQAFEWLVSYLEEHLPEEKFQNLHIHFSPVEFGPKGERRHRNSDDPSWGPHFEFLAQVILKRSWNPVIICEASGKQVHDALLYQRIFLEIQDKHHSQKY